MILFKVFTGQYALCNSLSINCAQDPDILTHNLGNMSLN
jgi:hypothetical protein